MKNKIVGNQRYLTSDKDMILTDGVSLVTTVIMPIDADESVWREITEEEAEGIIARLEADANV